MSDPTMPIAGNVVHNLRAVDYRKADEACDWALPRGFDLPVEGQAPGSMSMAACTVGLDCDTSGVSDAGPTAALPDDFPTMESNL